METTSTKKVLVIAVVALGLALAGPGAAAAHSGPIELTLAETGDGGLIVSAVYTVDGHQVTQLMNPVVTAVAGDGATTGPISLISSAEGAGLWITETPILGKGDWTVTVSTTVPSNATITTKMSVGELAPPIVADGEPAESLADASTDCGGAWKWAAAGGGLLAIVGVLYLLRRRVMCGAMVDS